MTEATIEANGVRLWCETFGADRDPAMLLIMGLGAQAIAWPDAFCDRLAAAGYYVIRYDNRDVGLSEWFDETPELYTLDDMARDAVGLLDALGIQRAHIVGVSMGGMIAQVVALDHAARVLTLTSIMSTPGGPDLEPPTAEAVAVLGRPPADTRDEQIAAGMENRRVLAAGSFPADEGFRLDIVTRSIDRAFHPQGTMRQMFAVGASPPRAERLASLTVPTLVMHGTVDPLIPHSHGVATAKAIPGASLVSIDGMGHELPPSVWDELVAAILRHTGSG
jgi:pimeloyl-ACP methyl ester carboxylesterase